MPNDNVSPKNLVRLAEWLHDMEEQRKEHDKLREYYSRQFLEELKERRHKDE